ncbi:unnamed protein product [Soboliphyme baturini]|uniref:CAP_N domain-containing protein n=1 Tax=Soboliphyme baturini TaxID=241478 RepID=A0A183J5U2_9BILA|nr:unnamed protein product [Soboliphyme baturini]
MMEIVEYTTLIVCNGTIKMEPRSVALYDEQVITPVRRFVSISSKISPEVAELGDLVNAAFSAQKSFIGTAMQTSNPTKEQLLQLLRPTSDKIDAIMDLRNSKRSSAFFNHLSTISESIPALGWINVVPAPASFIKEMEDASQFYANRVLKDFKDKDPIHAHWVKAWTEVLTNLYNYVKTNHTSGLTWNLNKVRFEITSFTRESHFDKNKVA